MSKRPKSVLKTQSGLYIKHCNIDTCCNFFTSIFPLTRQCFSHQEQQKSAVLHDAEIQIRIQGLPVEHAEFLVQLSESSGKSVSTIIRNIKLLRSSL